jgi:hypothetical protein
MNFFFFKIFKFNLLTCSSLVYDLNIPTKGAIWTATSKPTFIVLTTKGKKEEDKTLITR